MTRTSTLPGIRMNKIPVSLRFAVAFSNIGSVRFVRLWKSITVWARYLNTRPITLVQPATGWLSVKQRWYSRTTPSRKKGDDKALLYDFWSQMAVRYGLRIAGLRCEFYRMVPRDPTYAKLVMPSLEQRNELPAADDLVEPMEKLETHICSQLMKAVATLNARNARSVPERGALPRASSRHSIWTLSLARNASSC
ncbi:unnamed protein product [Chondrus crispus]|uniref:Uncharacterized protein n=1 Tax=Chondrus crispus TaxID=2769 RepID=R7QRN7_CHOCR|nr:unnamed protein product [Chondrus crispus]CDF40814.1 unnamed protein product [Chondrus crispus]|eukprot:XP_005711108.1 unnamed protein product [Chondrus crispus]